MAMDFIKIQGAREHNLKNVSLSIPKGTMTVFTGVSGSGKSSLAFDTLFAEGQRKYVESLSAYARQFLGQLKKPDVDRIDGLAPAIAIEQKTVAGSPRSTIATSAEIYDYLRVIYTHLGRPHCPESGAPMSRSSPSDLVEEILELPQNSRVILLAPLVDNERGSFGPLLNKAAKEGFVRARINGQLHELGDLESYAWDARRRYRIEIVVDRIILRDGVEARVSDSVELGLRTGEGKLRLRIQSPENKENDQWEERDRSIYLISPSTGAAYEAPTPRSFSFNSPHGACPECQGLGRVELLDMAAMLPDRSLSLADGAFLPWKEKKSPIEPTRARLLTPFLKRHRVALETPLKAYPKAALDALIHGESTERPKPFPGLLPLIEAAWNESESGSTRSRLRRYFTSHLCPSCGGRRLRPEALAITLGGKEDFQIPGRPFPGASIMDVAGMTVRRAREFFDRLEWSAFEMAIGGEAIAEVKRRLRFLEDVGVGYLGLNRESATLSGGESQRIRLATQIGGGLSGALYVLDEPSIGLHQRDNERLLDALERLRQLGNTLVVVEHDEDTIRRAEHLVDFGPAAGARGGEIVAQGSPQQVMDTSDGLTAKYLRGALKIETPNTRKPFAPDGPALRIRGAEENNLKNIDAAFPIGLMTCVTGVSGSGKSTLAHQILSRGLAKRLHRANEEPGKHRAIEGIELLERVALIDQTPIGRSSRSSPASYCGVWDEIRRLFSQLPAAKIRGYGAGRFSFNVKGGRCEQCQGDGALRIDMHFLPPAFVPCERCEGRRFNRETLEIRYKGLHIADTLELTIDEAVAFFRAVPKIAQPLRRLQDVGLGYLKLGQPSSTLSGGEAQRLKIGTELGKRGTERALYILDEPTTGLHFHDVSVLIAALMRLRNAGATLVVIEHHIDVIKNADWVVDLGPDGGEGGGEVVEQGPPEAIAANPRSETGRFLGRALSLSGASS